MAKRKDEIMKHARVTRSSSMKSAAVEDETKKKSSATEEGDDVTPDSQAVEMSTKKPKTGRNGKKSQAVTSRDQEEQKVNISAASLFKNDDMLKQVVGRISVIESGKSEPQLKLSKKGKVVDISTEKGKQRSVNSTEAAKSARMFCPGDAVKIPVLETTTERRTSANTSPNTVKMSPTSPFSKYIPIVAKQSEALGAKSKKGIIATDTLASTESLIYEQKQKYEKDLLLLISAERTKLENERRRLQAKVDYNDQKREILEASLNIESGNELYFLGESQLFDSKKINIEESIRPFILVTDKSTQTDPVPESPTIFRHDEDENTATLIVDTCNSSGAEALKVDTGNLSGAEALKVDTGNSSGAEALNVDTGNSSGSEAQNVDTGNSSGSEATTSFPNEEQDAEISLEDIEAFYISGLKIIFEDLTRETKANLKKFEEEFIKCINKK